VVAHDGERIQPVYAFFKPSLHANLRNLLQRGERKTAQWLAVNNACSTDFSDIPDIFQNINTPEQQQLLQNQADAS
jgi:molybdopterin-guanine dinucleotide biosynthesis protein A